MVNHPNLDRNQALYPDRLWLPEDFSLEESKIYQRPFHTFLIKIATLCNLNCSYCYVYQSADKSWQWKPKFLEKEVAEVISFRINEHVIIHSLDEISIVFHGGEPLLAGYERIKYLIELFENRVGCTINWGMQTNGILLNSRIIELLFKHNIRFGLSLDGPLQQNDANRPYHNGKGSYNDVIKGLDLIKKNSSWRKVLGGVLTVIDLQSKPRDILEEITRQKVNSVNLLLPDGHHDSLPIGKDSFSNTVYGEWLCDLFVLWFQEFQHIEIPFFEEIINLMIGGVSSSEEIGAKSVDLIVVETNGDIEAVDTLKVVGRKATSLDLNVKLNSFDEALEHPAVYSRMSGYHSLCKECRQCPFIENCGGGYIPHRYSEMNGFINPSIYCYDLKMLFQLIKKTITENVS